MEIQSDCEMLHYIRVKKNISFAYEAFKYAVDFIYVILRSR